MIKFVFSSLFLVALVSSLGLLVGSTQPVSAGMSFKEGQWWALWDKGEIPVVISNTFTSKQKNTIKREMSAWEKETNYAIRFRSLNLLDTRYVYIVTHHEYEELTLDYEQGPCGSWGPQPEGEGPTYIWLTKPNPFLNQPGCINKPSILHESGHAIGLGHEHLRPDRDLYMSFDAGYVPDPTEDAPVGFFDYFSIMHSWGVLDNSTPLASGISWTPPPTDLSEGDIDTVRALYAFDIHIESDIVGGDFANFPLVRGATQRDCQLACAADVRCKAYTYDARGVLPWNNVDSRCFLKNDDSIEFSYGPGLTSGKRKKGQQGSFGVARHVDLFGGQISLGVVHMPNNLLNGDNCKDLCVDDADCDAFTFEAGENSGTCFKKTHNPDSSEQHFTYVRQPGFLSGVVRRWEPRHYWLP